MNYVPGTINTLYITKLHVGGKRGSGCLEEEEAELAEGDLKRLCDPVVANYWTLSSNSLES